MQLIALNYQTIDSFQILNMSLFEQNRNAGFVLKPAVLWNKEHPEYGKFNPFERKKDGEYVSFYLKLISGQYLTENLANGGANTNSSSSNNANSSSSGINSSISVAGMSISGGGISVSNNGNGGSSFSGNQASSGSYSHYQQQHYHHHHRSSGVELLQTSSLFVEIEILGIPCDCTKEKTKTFNRNALNPIWNEEFVFHVSFLLNTNSSLFILVG
jgi:hypothetical protein